MTRFGDELTIPHAYATLLKEQEAEIQSLRKEVVHLKKMLTLTSAVPCTYDATTLLGSLRMSHKEQATSFPSLVASQHGEPQLRETARRLHALAAANDKQLQRARVLFQRVFAEVPVGLMLMNLSGIILEANYTMEQFTGMPASELEGRVFFDFISEEHRQQAEAFLCLSTEPTLGKAYAVHHDTMPLMRANGEFRLCELSSTIIQTEYCQEGVRILVVQDVTEEQSSRREAIRVGLLATIGELAAGVAHEINSPINAIINYADLVMDEVVSMPDVHEMALRIRDEGRRVARITHNLLSFAGEHHTPDIHAHLHEVLADALLLSSALLRGDGINVITDVSASLPVVHGFKNELLHVFLSIISNARYALNEAAREGKSLLRLSIQSSSMQTEQNIQMVRTVFCDTGTGIQPSIQSRIFETFFTTKPEGYGTGLGLSICRSIIEKYNGCIVIESDGQTGTSVIIDLPVAGYERGN